MITKRRFDRAIRLRREADAVIGAYMDQTRLFSVLFYRRGARRSFPHCELIAAKDRRAALRHPHFARGLKESKAYKWTIIDVT